MATSAGGEDGATDVDTSNPPSPVYFPIDWYPPDTFTPLRWGGRDGPTSEGNTDKGAERQHAAYEGAINSGHYEIADRLPRGCPTSNRVIVPSSSPLARLLFPFEEDLFKNGEEDTHSWSSESDSDSARDDSFLHKILRTESERIQRLYRDHNEVPELSRCPRINKEADPYYVKGDQSHVVPSRQPTQLSHRQVEVDSFFQELFETTEIDQLQGDDYDRPPTSDYLTPTFFTPESTKNMDARQRDNAEAALFPPAACNSDPAPSVVTKGDQLGNPNQCSVFGARTAQCSQTECNVMSSEQSICSSYTMELTDAINSSLLADDFSHTEAGDGFDALYTIGEDEDFYSELFHDLKPGGVLHDFQECVVEAMFDDFLASMAEDRESITTAGTDDSSPARAPYKSSTDHPVHQCTHVQIKQDMKCSHRGLIRRRLRDLRIDFEDVPSATAIQPRIGMAIVRAPPTVITKGDQVRAQMAMAAQTLQQIIALLRRKGISGRPSCHHTRNKLNPGLV